MRRKKTLLILISNLLGFIAANSSLALSSDGKQLAHFTADQAVYNYKDHIATFIGNVIMVQGSTQLMADKVIVYRTASGQIEKMLAYGNLAHYKTMPDNDARELQASANTIEYLPIKGTTILTSNASIQQGENEIHSPRIIYNRIQALMKTFPDQYSRTKIVINPASPPKGDNSASKQAT